MLCLVCFVLFLEILVGDDDVKMVDFIEDTIFDFLLENVL